MTSPAVSFGNINWQTKDESGVEWCCEDLQGWADLPETNAELHPRSLDYGAYFNDTWYGARILTLTGAILAPDQYLLQLALGALRAQHWDSLRADIPLTVKEVDGSKYLAVRAGKVSVTVTYISPLAVRISMELFAAWPVKRDAVRTLTAEGTTAGVGRTYPRGGDNYPWWTYGASGSTGDLEAVNAGNAPVRPQFTIAGPVVNPSIYHVQSDCRLKFDITLAAGDVLGIDTDTHAVVLNDVSNRRYVLTSDSAWFEFGPGVNTIQYRSDNNSGVLTCYYSDGWW